MMMLAQATEKMGYKRYWIAEHHNMKAVTSSATAMLINRILEHTKSIRVGSGCVNVVAADSTEEANYELSALLQFYLDIFTNKGEPLKPPVKNTEKSLISSEVNLLNSRLATTLVGDHQTSSQQLMSFQQQYEADEIMAVTYIYDMEKQIRSYEILKEVVESI